MAILLTPDPSAEAQARQFAARGNLPAAVDLLRPSLEQAVAASRTATVTPDDPADALERLFAETDAYLDRTFGPDRAPLPEAVFDRANAYDDLRRAGLGSDDDVSPEE